MMTIIISTTTTSIILTKGIYSAIIGIQLLVDHFIEHKY